VVSGGHLKRLFTCVELPTEFLSSLNRIQECLNVPSARWTRPEQMHITIAFLGDLAIEGQKALTQVVGEAAAQEQPFDAQISGIGAFPDFRKPRVIWAGVSEGTAELVRIEKVIVGGSRRAGLVPKRSAGFHPHITLGRLSRALTGAECRTLEQSARRCSGERFSGSSDWKITVDALTIMSSRLSSAGSTYTVEDRFRLRPPHTVPRS
jgi:2'-5' RNA ligase